MSIAHAWAAPAAHEPFIPFSFERRELRPDDVRIDILFCGICHSDVHFVSGDWGAPDYPCVPGHEIVGRVSAVGKEVSKYKIGDMVGVGCMVDSCGHCSSCSEGLEQYCSDGLVGTYMGVETGTGRQTYGGYSDFIVVRESFVLKIRHAEADLPGVAPLLCAGITTWSPLKHWGAAPGKKVGVVGIGGLGHMGLKLAHALGAHVVAFTSSTAKAAEARRLGADEVVVTSEKGSEVRHRDSFDLILNTVSAAQNLDYYTSLLRRDGALVLLGAGIEPHTGLSPMGLLSRRRSVAGSAIGGIAETQEMLDFCAEHGITSDIERIAVSEVDAAYKRILVSDVQYRFAIDMKTLPQD